MCGLKYTVEGRERIPAGNHIVMSNHTSAWETIAQFLIFPPQVWVLKRELLWIPFIGWGLKLLQPMHGIHSSSRFSTQTCGGKIRNWAMVSHADV